MRRYVIIPSYDDSSFVHPISADDQIQIRLHMQKNKCKTKVMSLFRKEVALLAIISFYLVYVSFFII